jgi:hypothetical protein
MKLGYLARGNNGTEWHLTNTDKSPRQQLLEKMCSSHADKMYVDDKEGNAKHVGYIVRGEWFTIYEVHEWTGDKP